MFTLTELGFILLDLEYVKSERMGGYVDEDRRRDELIKKIEQLARDIDGKF